MGMLPGFGPGYAPTESGMDTDAMLAAAREGNLRVLSILGANPALYVPGGDLVREALKNVPFVVVSDLFMTQTAELATLVLPARGPFEKDGTTINLAGTLLPVNAAHSLDSPQGVLSDLEMLIGLAEKLHTPLPTVEEVHDKVIACAATAGAFTLGDDAFARASAPASAQNPQDGALKVALQTRIFAGGGTSAHDERLGDLRPLPEAAIAQARRRCARSDHVRLRRHYRRQHDDARFADRSARGDAARSDRLDRRLAGRCRKSFRARR